MLASVLECSCSPWSCLLHFCALFASEVTLVHAVLLHASCIALMQAVLYVGQLSMKRSSSWCRLELGFITSAYDMCCTYSLHQMGSLTWHPACVTQQQELSSMVLKVLKTQINAVTHDKSLNHKVVLTAALFFMAMNPASTVAKSPNQQARMLCHGE